MKTSTKIAIATTAATAAILFVGGVIREIRQIKKLTTDVDDAMPEEILYEVEVPGTEETAQETVADAAEA